MKLLFKIALLLIATTALAQQSNPNIKSYYEHQQPEKVYAHLNNVLYAPEETVYYKIYTTAANNSPVTKSDYVYVDILDPSGNKADAQAYMLETGGASGSFTLSAEAPSGMYLLRAYTKYQMQADDTPFEKQFFVQKVITPRVLMTLDFKKKGYGAGERCEADFTLKNNQNQPIRKYEVTFDVFIAGKVINTLTATTDMDGKATLAFNLPADLKTNDGIINVKVLYDNIQESITRSVPINLNFVDVQFLPESGNYVANRPAKVFFIAKNEFDKPLDVSGYVQDARGNKVRDFSSFYNGMGEVSFTPKANEKYTAVITSPFTSTTLYELPAVLPEGYQFSVAEEQDELNIALYGNDAAQGELLLRSQDKVVNTIPFTLKNGMSGISIGTKDFPMGTYALSMVIGGQIVAERLVFLNYQDGLKIDITTDKKEYRPREKVNVTLTTKDKSGKPIPSSLSVTVVDEKLLSYMDDKQHNLLTWMLFGAEVKGKVHEPRFYFDEKEPLQKRLTALSLLLNTHGWRRFTQNALNNYTGTQPLPLPEKGSDIEGFVLDEKEKPASVKVYLFSDSGKVYETFTNKWGYFKFTRTHFNNGAVLAAESKNKKRYTIKNSVSGFQEVMSLKYNTKNADPDFRDVGLPVKPSVKTTVGRAPLNGERIEMKEDAQLLEDVVVIGYGVQRKEVLTGAIVKVSANELGRGLAGRVAGLQVQNGTGAPGSNDKIMIRGAGSIYGSRAAGQPLIIIDGVPHMNNENASVLGTLNPDMIASITVLKDAGATALYGGAGAGGVIIVTTKKGAGGNGILIGKKYGYTFEAINKNTAKKLNTPAAFYAPVYETTDTDEKTDFRTCLYWNAIIQTGTDGKAAFSYYNSDETTSFSIMAEGTSYKGNLGMGKFTYTVKEPMETDLKLPLFATQGDEIKIPVRIKNNSGKMVTVSAVIENSDYFTSAEANTSVSLAANESRVLYFAVQAVKVGNKIPVRIKLTGSSYSTNIEKQLDIYTKGFPKTINFSGTASGTETFTITDPIPVTLQSEIKFFTNPYNSVADGLESMLREPYGCFEQASSTNYPNVIALQLINSRGGMDDALKQKAVTLLQNGYNKLTGYECKSGGFEWFGHDPGHEALTAYGLLQFHEMEQFIKVDKKMVERTIAWLYKRKDGNGGFKHRGGLDAFGLGQAKVANAYIVYVLSEIGQKDFDTEYQTALAEALKTKDLYRSALMALAAYNLKDIKSYDTLIANIRQATKGQDFKVEPESTIVNSQNISKKIEWVSFYAMALMKDGKPDPELQELLDFIQSARKQTGYGSSQATALALKAIVTYNGMVAASPGPAQVNATLNNVALNTALQDNGGNIKLNTAANLTNGSNTIDVKIDAERPVPYLFYVTYSSYQPENSPACELALKTTLTQSKLKVSETTRLTAEVTNTTNAAVPNPLVRIGIPGGTSPELWQLKELVEKGVIAYYEMFGSELVLYFRELKPQETRTINIDLKAQVPGTYRGIASSAYLYYNNEHKNWNSGLQVEVVE